MDSAISEYLKNARVTSDQNRRFFTVLAAVMCVVLAVDSVLNEFRTQRITKRLSTTPREVREAVEGLAAAEKENAIALTRSLYFFDVLEASSDCFIQIDSGGYICRWSRGAETLFGYSRIEAVGLHVSTLMPADVMEKHRDKYAHAMLDVNLGVNRRRLLEVVAINAEGREVSVRLQLWIAPQLGAVARIVKTGKP